MADIAKTQEGNKKVMYKFGESELDLNRYIHNLDTNLQGYMNSKNWNEGQREEFIKAYDRYLAGLKDQFANNTNRFSTTSYGSIIDTTGEFSNKDNDDIDPAGSEYYYDDKGNRITTDDLNMLKQRKQKNYNAFSANREIASYFNTVGTALRNATTSEPTKQNKFNLQKHGFIANFNNNYSLSGETIDPSLFWDKDPADPITGKRGTANRADFLRKQIENYRANLGEHDFSETPLKDRDTYLARLKAASDSLANGYNSESALALNQAGIGGEFLKNFFATGAEEQAQTLTPLEQEALKAKQAQEEREKNDQLKSIITDNDQDIYNRSRNEYFSKYMQQNPFKSSINTTAVPLSYDYDKFTESLLKSKKIDINNEESIKDTIKKHINFSDVSNFIRGKKKLMLGQNDITQQTIANRLDLAAQHNLFDTPIGNSGYYVIPGSENYDNWSYMAYNPKLRKYEEQSMLLNDELREKMAYSQYDKLNKQLPKHQLGGGIKTLERLRERANKKQNIQKQAEDTGRDPQKAIAGNREVGSPFGSDKEWSAVDKARLTAAGADILSLIAAYVPGYGTIASAGLGVGSTLTNFGADLADESTSWGDRFRNLGVGLASDAVGLIPGLGSAGKVGKIAKTLKYILPTAIAGWSAYSNGGQYIQAANKLMSDPNKMTVDDWRSLGEGLQVTMGLGKLHAGNRQANKYASKNITAEQYATLRSKSGKDLRFTPEKAKQISKASGYEEQNKIFQIEHPGESLAGEFNSKLFKKNPKIGKGVDYTKSNVDYSQSERIPWHYKGKDGKIVPRTLSNDAIQNWLSSKSLWNGPNTQNWGTRKNPLYNTANVKPQIKSATSVEPPPSQHKTIPIDKTNAETIVTNQTIPAHTPIGKIFNYKAPSTGAARIAQQNKYERVFGSKVQADNDAEWNKMLDEKEVSDLYRSIDELPISPNFRRPLQTELTYQTPTSTKIPTAKFTVEQKNLARVQQLAQSKLARKAASQNNTLPHKQKKPKQQKVEKRGYVNKKEEGGSINLASIRKFQKAGKITNTTSTANWFNDMYSSNPMKQWLGTFNKDNYNDFNNLQKSWSSNLKATQFVPGATPVDYNQGVFDRQGLWEGTGTNAAIEDLVAKGVIKRPGVSGDNTTGKHQDGYFGNQEYLRHGGTKESWAGKEAELKQFQDEVAKRGLNYQLDNESGMYLLSVMSENPVSTSSTQPDKVVNNAALTDVAGEKKQPVSTPKNGVLTGMFNNPTVLYGLPRAMYADRINRKLTDMAKDSITPLLKDPMQVNRITRGDLDAEVRGQKTYANLRNMASKPISSDANIQQAMQLEAELKGQEAINAGQAQSNQVQRQYDEMAWQQGKENASNRHETSMYNRAQQWGVNQDKSKMEQAYQLKQHEIWDTFGKQIEFDARNKQLENKQKTDTFAAIDIKNAVAGDPNQFGADLTSDELVLWDKYQSGVSPSTGFNDDERRKLGLIQQKISMAEQNQLREHYGIPANNWSGASKRPQAYNVTIKEKGGVISAKKGAKIALAGIEAKTADAERFQRQIKETIDRNEKSLERLSKSLYGIIKSSTIK